MSDPAIRPALPVVLCGPFVRFALAGHESPLPGRSPCDPWNTVGAALDEDTHLAIWAGPIFCGLWLDSQDLTGERWPRLHLWERRLWRRQTRAILAHPGVAAQRLLWALLCRGRRLPDLAGDVEAWLDREILTPAVRRAQKTYRDLFPSRGHGARPTPRRGGVEDLKQDLWVAVLGGLLIERRRPRDVMPYLRGAVRYLIDKMAAEARRELDRTLPLDLGDADEAISAHVSGQATVEVQAVTDVIEAMVMAERVWPHLSRGERTVVILLLFGYRDTEIAAALGVSRARISQIGDQIAAKGRRFLGGPST